MFGIGTFEIFVIVVVALLVLGPKEFMNILKWGASYYKKIQNFQKKMHTEISNVFDKAKPTESSIMLKEEEQPFGSQEFLKYAKRNLSKNSTTDSNQ